MGITTRHVARPEVGSVTPPPTRHSLGPRHAAEPSRAAVARRNLLLTAAAASAAGVLLGGLAGAGLPLLLLLAVLVAPAMVVGTLAGPELGLLALVLTIYTHVSDVAVAVYGTPSLLQPLLLLLLMSLAVRAVRDKALPSGLATPAVLLFSYGFVLSLSLFHARDSEAATEALNGYLRDAVIALLVVALLRTATTLERALWVLVLAGGALAALGVAQYLTGSFDNDFGGFARASVKNISAGNEDFRISGPIADPNHYAQALLVIVPLALGRARYGRRAMSRATAGGALAVCLFAVVFTYSRGALIALAVLAIVAVIERPPPTWAFAVGGVLVLVVLPLLPPGYTDRLSQLADAVPGVSSGRTGEASLSGRLSALRAGARMVLDRPVLGVGVGQFQPYYRDYAVGLGIDTVKGGLPPHNMYLEVASETGYLGIVTWGALVGTALRRTGRGIRRLRAASRAREAKLLQDLRLGLYGYLLSGLFVHNAYPRLFWLLIGMAMAVPVVVSGLLAGQTGTDAETLEREGAPA